MLIIMRWAGQHGRLVCATPAVLKPGDPRVPCSLEPRRQGSPVCLVSRVPLCGKEASTTPEPSRDRPPAHPRQPQSQQPWDVRGACRVPREWQVAAVAPLGPGPPASCHPLWAPCPNLRGIPQPRLCLATAYSSPLLHLSSLVLASALGPSGHQHLLPSPVPPGCTAAPVTSPSSG